MTIIAVMVMTVAIVAMITTGDIYDSVPGKGPLFCALFPYMTTVLLPHGKTLNLIHAYITSCFELAASTSGASGGFGSGVVEGKE